VPTHVCLAARMRWWQSELGVVCNDAKMMTVETLPYSSSATPLVQDSRIVVAERCSVTTRQVTFKM
jgi:hypothetical protein